MGSITQEEIVIKIDKLIAEGKGLGYHQNTTVYVDGVLPGEIVKVRIKSIKKDYYEAELIDVVEPSKFRRPNIENHYLSCSPWQVIDYQYQLSLKQELIQRCFLSVAHKVLSLPEIVPSREIWGYRNKMEFGFSDDGNHLSLGFHKRGSYKHMVSLDQGCQLAPKELNEKALEVIQLLRETDIELFDLKSLVVRYSFYENKAITMLFVKNEGKRVQKLLKQLSDARIKEFAVALSSHKTPRPVIDKILFSNSNLTLKEKLGELVFEYSIECFFQNNIRLFTEVLEDIIRQIPQNSSILELYCGVGSIGLYCAQKAKHVIGVEIVEQSVEYAKINAVNNNLHNFQATHLPSEKVDSSIFQGIDILILDPPRAGLHKNVIKLIQTNPPEQIIYLSCNPTSQARDFSYLKDNYELQFIKAYDFYPNTPHVENLIILKRK